MTQRILVDLLGFSGGRGGTETYAREICRRLPDALPDAAFLALTGRAGAEAVRAFFPGAVRVVSGVGAGRVSWAAGEVFTVNALARRFGADLVWTPPISGPSSAGCRGCRRCTTSSTTTPSRTGGCRCPPGYRLRS